MGKGAARMPEAFLGLGSNLGNRGRNLGRAVREITQRGVLLKAISSVYHSFPEGALDQPDFLNQVLQVETVLSPAGLLGVCLEVEARMGRRRVIPGGPRIIDVDLLLNGGETCSSERLTLPHPALHRRRFVLEPLCEICPEVRHPVLGLTARELLRNLGQAGRPLLRVGPAPGSRRAPGPQDPAGGEPGAGGTRPGPGGCSGTRMGGT